MSEAPAALPAGAAEAPAPAASPAPPARTVGRPRSARAERAIRDAAVALLAERGIGGFAIEVVAARAGVAKTTIYRRWPTREDLIIAAVVELKGPPVHGPGESVRGDLLHALRETGRPDPASPWGPLMARLLADAEEHPALVAEIWRHSVGPRRAYLTGVLRRGIDEGTVPADADLELLVDMLVSPIVNRLRLKRAALTDAQIETVLDIVLTGVRP